MENLWKDIKFGLRSLVRNPATTGLALLTLGLGIGLNSAIFTIVNAVLLRPLDYQEPERLMLVRERNQQLGFPQFSVSALNYKDWRDQNKVFDPLVAVQSARVNLTGTDAPEVLEGARVTSDFFRALRTPGGSAPFELGRGFTADEDRPHSARVVVLSHDLWQRRFGASPSILGRTIGIDGEPHAVVGVARSGFTFPRKSMFWMPAGFDWAREARGAHSLTVIGRLKPGVSIARARTEMAGIAARLAHQYPDIQTGWDVILDPLQDVIVKDIRPKISMLMVFVWVVLLIACLNVANLLLSRVVAREREIAMRSALGARRQRLVRQLLTESAVLFGGGGLLGLAVAYVATRILVALNPDAIPRSSEIGLDGRVLLYTMAVALATGLAVGLLPALSAVGGGSRLYGALKEGGRAVAGGAFGQLVRSGLVLVEVALALVLLVFAGLLLHSFARLQGQDPGFQPRGVLTAQLSLPAAKYKAQPVQAAFFRNLLRVRALPGVTHAATVFPLPLDQGGFILAFELKGHPVTNPSQLPSAAVHVVSPDYFSTLGIRTIRGRVFNDGDRENSQLVIVVSRPMAEKFWPGEDPIGKSLTFDVGAPKETWRTVVGVVDGTRHTQIGEDPDPEIYWPQFQDAIETGTLVVRTSGDPGALAGPVRAAVLALDRDQPLSKVRTMQEVVAASLAQSRVNAVLLAIFAGVALALAVIGVYGLVSHSVAQRTHEIGIRMALGARPGEVLWLVVRRGMLWVAAGLALGLVFAVLSTRLIKGQLYQIQSSEPAMYGLVALALAGVALLANYVPARRATRVDPLEALRYE